MSGFLDTSVIVRYLTGDPPDMFEKATQIIENAEDLKVTEGVLAETAFVLSSVYQMPRSKVVDLIIALVKRANLSTYALNKSLVLEGLTMCRPSGRVSFADALLWAAARTDGAAAMYSMDERFPDDGLEIRRGL